MVIIFDYDGTCYETLGLYGNAVRRAEKWVNSQGYFAAYHSEDYNLKKYLGMTAEDMWEDFLPGAPSEITKKASLIVQRNMILGIKDRASKLYDGMENLFDELKKKGHTLVVLSNCTTKYKETNWEEFGLSKWFSDFYCSEDYNGIPKEEIFKSIAQKYPGEYVIVGDRYSDMKVGYTHNFTTVACLYGYGNLRELEGASFHANSVEELKEILLNEIENQ